MTAAAPPAHADAIFRAFADPTRLRLLSLLATGGEICVCDLMRVLDLPQAKVSRHLAHLRQAGLVQTRREAQWVHYRLSRAQGPLHRKMLGCLKCCLEEEPQLQADRTKLGAAQDGCGDRSCC